MNNRPFGMEPTKAMGNQIHILCASLPAAQAYCRKNGGYPHMITGSGQLQYISEMVILRDPDPTAQVKFYASNPSIMSNMKLLIGKGKLKVIFVDP